MTDTRTKQDIAVEQQDLAAQLADEPAWPEWWDAARLPKARKNWAEFNAEEREIYLDKLAVLREKRKTFEAAKQEWDWQERIVRQEGLRPMLRRRREEAESMTPEEAAAAEADWNDFKQSMNENRYPGPPLYP